eukprot:TRINITY_DN24879_c0_g1_i1.p1 TRINITY_DN24879_c0_g1~~TRINITY_DN24879_c0_g1_i1.p1  ORF type:complete len:475 (-),score=67.49 TRINITY_DN24879_c0_g1_i1:42-1388(-)
MMAAQSEHATELVALRSAGTNDDSPNGLGLATLHSSLPAASVEIAEGFFQTLREQEVTDDVYPQHDSGYWSAALSECLAHLEAHPSWSQDRFAMSAEELRSRVALQYFTWVDVEDLKLPPEQRQNHDAFADTGVSKQFLLDAAHSSFVFDGEELNFLAELKSSNFDPAADDVAAAARLRDFEHRLVDALIRCLGGHPQRLLLQCVSRCMSQSGVANIERVCFGPAVVVSGGEQTLQHTLTTVSPDSWEVRTAVCKQGFEDLVLVDEAPEGGECKASSLQCGPASRVVRRSTICFSMSASRSAPSESVDGVENTGCADLRAEGEEVCNVSVDVCDFEGSLNLVDSNERPIDLSGRVQAYRRKRFRDRVWRHASSITLLIVGPLSRCKRRARGLAVECLPRCRSLMSGLGAAPTWEDAGHSVREPLREHTGTNASGCDNVDRGHLHYPPV